MKRNTLITKLTLIMSILTFSVHAQNACPVFEEEQLKVLQKSYELGKPHDLGHTLATIAYHESEAGKFVINAITSDYGIYQGNVRTICAQAGVRHNNFLCNIEIQRIIENHEHAANHAIETLKYWKDYHSKREKSFLVYENMIRSYNGGFNFTKVDEYWKDFRTKFHEIKRCVSFASA